MQGLGGRVEREIPLIRGFSARVPRSAVRALRGAPGVLSVHADRRFTLRSTTDAARHAEHHARRAARAPSAPTRVDGGPADVALDRLGRLARRRARRPRGQRPRLLRRRARRGAAPPRRLRARHAPRRHHRRRRPAGPRRQRQGRRPRGLTSLGACSPASTGSPAAATADGLDVRVLNLAFGAEADGSYRNDPLAYAVERAWRRRPRRRRLRRQRRPRHRQPRLARL